MKCRLLGCLLLGLCMAVLVQAAPPFITVAGSTMLPLRNFADWVGAKVEFSEQTFSLSVQDTTFQLALNSHTALVNGVGVQLHPSALSKMGVLYVPLRQMADIFGIKLNWDEKNHVVMLTNPVTMKNSLLAYPPIISPSQQRLFVAVRSGDVGKVSAILLEQAELLNMQDSSGRTALYVAVETKNVTMVRFLLGKGADVNKRLTIDPLSRDPQYGGAYPLHAAVMIGNVDIVEALLAKKSPILADYLGVTPLHLAAKLGDMTMVQELIDHKARLDAKATLFPEMLDPQVLACADKVGYGTPAMMASEAGFDDIAAMLTDKGAPTLDKDLAKALVESAQLADAQTKQDDAARTECFKHLSQISAAFTQCLLDNDGNIPLAKDFWQQFQKYADADALVCPADPDETIGYGLNAMLCGKSLGSIKNPDKVVLFADCSNSNHLLWDEDDIARNRHGEGFYVLFCDGHKAFLSSDSDVRMR